MWFSFVAFNRSSLGIRLMILYKYRIFFDEILLSFHKHVMHDQCCQVCVKTILKTTSRAGSVKKGVGGGGTPKAQTN